MIRISLERAPPGIAVLRHGTPSVNHARATVSGANASLGIIGVRMRIAAGLALFIGIASAAFGQVQPPMERIIVKWRDGTASTAAAAGVRAQKLGASAGVRLERKQQIAIETDVLQLARALSSDE